MRKTYRTVQREIWVANNGREFDNEQACVEYEEKLEVAESTLDKIEFLKDVVPHTFSPYDDIHYTWYKANSPEDIKAIEETINVDWISLNNITSFPEYVCVETDYDDERYTETTLTKLMEEYAQFLKTFGVEVIYKTEEQ